MSNRIREVRERRGWNQRQLAEASHTCQALLSELERGTRRPWLLVAERISQALGASIEQLFPDDFKK